MLSKSGYLRLFLVSVLLGGIFARADNPAFDLSGPRLELKVTRAGKTLPVSQVPNLQPGDRILIAEACSNHALEDDIGRVKIPRWLRQYVGGDLQIDISTGRDYPNDLTNYKLILHCGGCMMNRREMLNRLRKAQESGVAVTNYGMAISFLQGVIKRSLAPFPSALAAFEKKIKEK